MLSFSLSYQIGWLIMAIIFGVIELATMGLTTIWFAIGALVAMIVAMIGLGLIWQIIFFLVISTICLYYTRPIAQKYLKVGSVKTNVNSIIGCVGIVTKSIEEHATGQCKVKGQIWTAKSYDGGSIAEQTEVKVMSVEGVKLIVTPKDFYKGE